MRECCRHLMSIAVFGFAFICGMNDVRADEVRALLMPELQDPSAVEGTYASITAENRPILFEGRKTVSGSGAEFRHVERTEEQTQAQSGIHFVVERVEGNEVILETGSGYVRFPREALPEGADYEGAVIRLSHASGEESRRLSSAHARIERMKLLSARYEEAK